MIRPHPVIGLAAVLLSAAVGRAETAVTTFPPALDSSAWTSLLQKYVDERGLVAYARWKEDAADRKRLSDYVAAFARPGGEPGDAARVALLINAYNAFMIETILDHYPVDSIRSIRGGFTAEAHAFGGRDYSLDEIEHTAVRLGGYLVHATMVCASRSCPPLDRRAFEAAGLVAHESERMRAWMARPDLYRFEPERNLARLPRYFDWYRSDFEKAGVPGVLARFAPPQYRDWLLAGKFQIEYLPYDWSLNDLQPAR